MEMIKRRNWSLIISSSGGIKHRPVSQHYDVIMTFGGMRSTCMISKHQRKPATYEVIVATYTVDTLRAYQVAAYLVGLFIPVSFGRRVKPPHGLLQVLPHRGQIGRLQFLRQPVGGGVVDHR